MFVEDTVFVLGAGSSVDYGYPTGKVLIRDCVGIAEEIRKISGSVIANKLYFPDQRVFFSQIYGENSSVSFPDQAWKSSLESCWIRFNAEVVDFINRVCAANPSVIDHFLSENPQLQTIGRILICNDILYCEKLAISKVHGGELDAVLSGNNQYSEESDWIKFIVEELANGAEGPVDILSNRVKFVTFNYDVSLEARIWHCLEARSRVWSPAAISQFLSADRFIHVYGGLGFGHNSYGTRDVKKITFAQFESSSETNSMIGVSEFLAQMTISLKFSSQLSLVSPKFDGRSENQRRAMESVASARNIFIFGFGFDSMNCKVLGLDKFNGSDGYGAHGRRSIYFTNYQNSDKINRLVGRLFCGLDTAFLGNKGTYPEKGNRPLYVAKSSKGVYAALAEDFVLADKSSI